MSTAKEKKYAKRMRNQPSNVSLDQGDRTPQSDPRRVLQEHRGSTSGQQQRGPYHSHGGHVGRGRGREASSEAPQIPKYITAAMFAQARASEINAMLKAVSQKSSNSLVFQSLPRHMRRRSMGHDIKRLPRRLREMAKKEMEKSVHQKKEQSKSKCRKAKRRHGNLLLEFNRRQRKNIWLETHIWFTKRFHMLKKWGYCLADRPTMKSYRACYRAMSNHCLLQDMSYLCCVELMGKEEDLLASLSRLCSIETGPTFAAAACLSGRRQGSLVMYKADKYPAGALGPVTFIWKPKSVPESSCETRQLWLWMHPTLKQGILQELRVVSVCEDRADNAVCDPAPLTASHQEEKPAAVTKITRKRKRKDKAGEKAVPVKRIFGDGTRAIPEPYQWSSTQTSIIIRDLTMEIVRYRLVGPLSHAVLADALHAAPLHKKLENADSGPHSWWADYCENPDNVVRHGQQGSIFQFLQGIASPAQIPPGTVLGLTIGDPRLNLPQKRSKSLPSLQPYEGGEEVRSLIRDGVPVECAQSLIWSSDIRSHVLENKVTEQEINRLRSELLVPGSKLDLGNKESKIPILLIQQPGKVTGQDRPGWGSGWDICLPKGWGMAFWIPLIYRGVRVGGLQQALQHCQYMGAPNVPGDIPDSPAGIQSALQKEAQLLDRYTRRPPAKRTNFIKHGIVAPFLCPWEQLTREWQARAGAELGVLEQKEDGKAKMTSGDAETEMKEDVAMEAVSAVGTEQKPAGEKDSNGATFSVLRNKKILRTMSGFCIPCGRGPQKTNGPPFPGLSDLASLVLKDFPRSLVWVRLSMMSKGSPELHSLICIPSEQDFIQLRKDKSFPGPVEPKLGDPFKNKVLKLKKEQKKQQKKQKSKPGQASKMETAADASAGTKLIMGLWPSPLPDVSAHCSRVLLGFVTQGDFSMVAGCGEALGFVSLTGLMHILLCQVGDRTGTVLIRNPSTLQYRFAKLTIDI